MKYQNYKNKNKRKNNANQRERRRMDGKEARPPL